MADQHGALPQPRAGRSAGAPGLPGEPDYIVAREHELFARDDAGRWIDAGEWNDRCRTAHDTFFEEHADVLGEVRSFTKSRNLAWWVKG